MRKSLIIFLMIFGLLAFTVCDDSGSSSSDKTGTASGSNVPANVTAVAVKGQVTLSWDTVSGADSYTIYWDVLPGVTTDDEPISVTDQLYEHVALSNNTTYYYAVSAVIDGTEGELSDEVWATPNFSTTEIEKLLATDPQEWDNFGITVSISGDYAIVGAPYENGGTGDSVSSAGAAYVFHRTGIDKWGDGVKLIAPDAQANDHFGSSVAISGDYAVVGAPDEDTGNSGAGAAYIFHRTGVNTWDSGVKIQSSATYTAGGFGTSVSITGDYVIAGATGADTTGSDDGAAYIFHRTGANAWDSGVTITASDAQASDWFGGAVSIGGDYAVVGATGEDAGGSNAGAAYIFHRTDTNIWDAGVKISAQDLQASDSFGCSVSISGDYAIVGAFREDGGDGDPLSNAGAAYIFHRTDANIWDSGVKIAAADLQANDNFGNAVAVNGDYAVVGSPNENGGSGDPVSGAGAAYIFHRIGANTWDEGLKITASDAQADDWFGISVGISGSYAIVGSYYEDEGGSDGAGAVYIY